MLTSRIGDRLTRHRVGSSLRIISEIYRTEGGIRALYRGLTPNIIGNSTSWSVYFLFYGNIKEAIARGRVHHDHEHDGKGDKLSASEYFLASGAAGTFPTTSYPEKPTTNLFLGCENRRPDINPHKPNLGNKNPHALHRLPHPRRIPILCIRRNPNPAHGGYPGLL
jgi:hypothetical protein